MAVSSSKLFQPIHIGDLTLAHRIALAPLTRFRANKAHVHGELAVEYYTQRAGVPGTLLISEGTYIAAKGSGLHNAPGIYTTDQIDAWKKITDSVHAKGSFMFMQLWAMGRTAEPEILRAEDPSFDVVGPSPIKLSDRTYTPRELSVTEIEEYVGLYAKAASNAVHKAGFDGVEVHMANGYLIDQFLQDTSNQRTDDYGGSIEKRSKFGLDIMEAVVQAVGAKKVGVRLSPWSKFEDMRMEDPIPTFTYLVNQLRDRYPDLAFVHVVEPRVYGSRDETVHEQQEYKAESNDFIREIWAPRPVISAGYRSPEEVIDAAETKGDIIAMGRYFISNPDLPLRIKLGIPWTPYDRATFYTPERAEGYIDYPFAHLASHE